jgi:TolB-like protein/Flp pilus assembly protein TadD
MPLAAGTRLGPYEILAPLGAGGMGEVYRARDSKLERDVAIKVLPETVATDPQALARFEREAKAVAALSHPNILAIFDFGKEGDAAYAVTELLEGETLRQRLDVGPLSPKQAVDWAQQIANGLSAAHEKGVVHRDLKPENIFVTRGGHLKILDFGLAKRVETVPPDQQTNAPTTPLRTEPGTLMGTISYMSPEQVKGLPVDHRSDIFSFGSILYEMLSGRRAFRKDTSPETMAAIMRDEPPELSASGRGIPMALDHIVKHCLEKDRKDRFQSARDIAFALSEASGTATVASGAQLAVRSPAWGTRTGIALAILAIVAVAGFLLLRRPHHAAVEPEGVKRVAVLPFENLGAPEDDYFADGIADEVRGKLTSIPGLEVIARGSSTPYRKTTKTPKLIAAELDARYLLTATVRWQKEGGASRVLVTPELVEVKESGTPASRWEQPFDARLTDVFQVQADIASKVASALGVALAEGEKKQLSERPTQNLAAYDAFLKGRQVDVRDALGARQRRGFYERAVALDPNFAEAWARLSEACSVIYFNDDPSHEMKERARVAAEKAAALSPHSAYTYTALVRYQQDVLLDNKTAFDVCTRGLRDFPRNAELLSLAGQSEGSLGRFEDAVSHLRQAGELDPRQARINSSYGQMLLWLRRYPEAREALDRALSLAPADPWVIANKVRTFLGEGDLTGARAILKTPGLDPTALMSPLFTFDLIWVMEEPQLDLLLRLTPSAFGDDAGAWNLALAMAFARRVDVAQTHAHAEAARKAVENQLSAAPEVAAFHCYLGLTSAYLGRKEDAIREGVRATEMTPISADAIFGMVFESLLVRIYLLVDEPEKALDVLERVLRVPGYLSPGWLKIDPNFDPLRKNPRFQKLIAQAK